MKNFLGLLCIFLLYANAFAQSNSTGKIYKLWDDRPAPNSGGDFDIKKAGGYPFDKDWESESYPIGNGYMGANLFGRTDTERIQITEKTLCNEGLYGLGGITNFAEIYLDFNHKNPQNYSRTLNLNKAVFRVKYTFEGVEYYRDCFMSYPDNVMVVKLSANKKGKVSFTLRPEIPYLNDSISESTRTGKVVVENDLITMSGMINTFSTNYETQIKVLNNGGSLTADNEGGNGKINVADANSVVLLIATGTNYELSQQLFLQTSKTKKLDASLKPHKKVSSVIKNALDKGFKKLLQTHLTDYHNLFARVDIDFGNQLPEIPTRELLENYKMGNANTYLEELMFQYGRYLLISSSRKGTLPSGLQGVWSQYHITPWTGGYWHNINVQMNYWGAFNTNLAETFEPYIEYHQAYIPAAKRNATDYIERWNPNELSEDEDDNGWTIGTAAGPYKISGPGGHSGPGTGGFTTKLLWDYYDFTRDTTFLREIGYPAILGMSKFLSKTVKPTEDGLLLVEPSASPEQRHNGPHYITVGTTFDQGFIWENHNDLLKASAILDVEDELLDLVKYQMPRLDPIIVGASGQIKEFREEVYYGDFGDKHHRHISHICPLYPGTLINSTTPEWLKAASVSLDLRGNNTTGWAMVHRMNSRARTREGNKAHEVFMKLIQERTLPNLWATHPPFQIDANLGCVAGVAEMLLQSHESYIEPLPALPSAWKNGQYKGLVARGNFEISAVWENGQASSFEIISRIGGECKIKYPGLSKSKLTDSKGKAVPFKTESPDIISFETKNGDIYTITP